MSAQQTASSPPDPRVGAISEDALRSDTSASTVPATQTNAEPSTTTITKSNIEAVPHTSVPGENVSIPNETASTAISVGSPTMGSGTALVEPIGSSHQAGGSTTVRVFNPAETPSSVSTPSELDESFFESTLSDVQAHHASVVSRSKRLNEAPLLTSKYREEEKEGREKRKAERWPSTTIRIKFSDGTQVQSVFPSSSPIQPVYAFVRTCLDPSASSNPFTLWQPPKFSYPEHPLPPAPGQAVKKRPLPPSSIVIPANYGPVRGAPMAGLTGGTGGRETLAELGLVPQSVLMIRWADDEMNATGHPAPLLPELRQKAEPLPSATSNRAEQKSSEGVQHGGTGEQPKEKKIPKWLQKGLLKKKK